MAWMARSFSVTRCTPCLSHFCNSYGNWMLLAFLLLISLSRICCGDHALSLFFKKIQALQNSNTYRQDRCGTRTSVSLHSKYGHGSGAERVFCGKLQNVPSYPPDRVVGTNRKREEKRVRNPYRKGN